MDLANGVSAVWLLVEGDDPAVNDQLEKGFERDSGASQS